MATYEITNAVRVTGTSRAPPRPSCRTFADRHFSSFHWNSWTKGSTEGNGTYGTTSSQQNKIKEHLPKSQKHHAKYHRKLLIYSISTPSCGALANGWTHFLGICEQFPLKVWMVFFRDYHILRTIIIKSWSIPKRDFLQSKHLGPSCNPSISLFVKDSKDRYRAVSKKLSNETKLFPGGRWLKQSIPLPQEMKPHQTRWANYRVLS